MTATKKPRRVVKEATRSPAGPQGGWAWWLDLHCQHQVVRRARYGWNPGAPNGRADLGPPSWVRCEYCPDGAESDPKGCFTR